MTCREFVELITEYLDGALAPQDRARVEEHLDRCEGCREHLDQVHTTLRMLKAIPALDPAPADVPGLGTLLDAFRDYTRAGH